MSSSLKQELKSSTSQYLHKKPSFYSCTPKEQNLATEHYVQFMSQTNFILTISKIKEKKNLNLQKSIKYKIFSKSKNVKII